MPAYNFKRQFVSPIRSGEKKTTIRFPRKRPTRVGDVLYLYTGMRTKKCELINVYVCEKVQPITIWPTIEDVSIELARLSRGEIADMARKDGFSTSFAFFHFFMNAYGPGPHHMELITWRNLTMEEYFGFSLEVKVIFEEEQH